jgi:hypothetical protein
MDFSPPGPKIPEAADICTVLQVSLLRVRESTILYAEYLFIAALKSFITISERTRWGRSWERPGLETTGTREEFSSSIPTRRKRPGFGSITGCEIIEEWQSVSIATREAACC